ncbi:MAG: hypothetical protein KDC46_12885 [Thermoleophilia bacterium]|nr:hypothetical protein [Thermoleophilia bacterium]
MRAPWTRGERRSDQRRPRRMWRRRRRRRSSLPDGPAGDVLHDAELRAALDDDRAAGARDYPWHG